jgi:hypothetical protein
MNYLNDLSYYVSTAHGIPTEHTTHTFMQYCYEHNLWAKSERVRTAHLEHHHLKPLNDYCGLIRRGGVVVVAAHCLFCLGNEEKTPHDRFAQYPDTYDLHKHMKTHITELIALPTVCPYPLCETRIESEAHFWEHANSAHGIPPFGPQRINRKRKSPEKGQENAHEYEHEDAYDGNKVGYAVGRGLEDGEFALGREGAEDSASAGTAKRETVSGKLETVNGSLITRFSIDDSYLHKRACT